MIKGERLFLRALEPTDIDILFQWENNTSLWKVSNTLVPFSRFAIEQYVLNSGTDIFSAKQLRLMICLNGESSAPIGAIDLFDFDPFHSRAGIGILIAEEYRNQGYAGEALKVLVAYCFNTLCVHQLYCNISEDNSASIKLFKEAGFVNTGIKKQWIKAGSKWIDELIFQNINKDFKSNE